MSAPNHKHQLKMRRHRGLVVNPMAPQMWEVHCTRCDLVVVAEDQAMAWYRAGREVQRQADGATIDAVRSAMWDLQVARDQAVVALAAEQCLPAGALPGWGCAGPGYTAVIGDLYLIVARCEEGGWDTEVARRRPDGELTTLDRGSEDLAIEAMVTCMAAAVPWVRLPLEEALADVDRANLDRRRAVVSLDNVDHEKAWIVVDCAYIEDAGDGEPLPVDESGGAGLGPLWTQVDETRWRIGLKVDDGVVAAIDNGGKVERLPAVPH